MSKWLKQHVQALSLVVARLKAHLLGSLLICAVIGVTLAIPSLMYIVIENTSHLVSDLKKGSQISVFLSQDIDQNTIEAIEKSLKANANIKNIRFVSKEEALKQLIESSKNNEIAATLETNPLPHAFFIEPNSISAETISSLQDEIKQISGVEQVVLDSAWMRKLNNLLNIGQQAVWILALLLGFALVAVIGNTIRMQLLTHQAEIEVSELFGATKSFIRRPFLYLGALYGVGGGLFAWFILWLVTRSFNQAVSKIALDYQTDFALQASNKTYLAILVLSLLIGWLAAYLGVTFKTNRN